MHSDGPVSQKWILWWKKPIWIQPFWPLGQTSWTVDIAVNGVLLTFKVDTGAEVTAISEQAYRALRRIKLEKSSKTLSEESRLLTTFITPFGHYRFKKLPFGISSAPEHFQCVMNKILAGLEGVVCLMDDTLVFGRSQEEHDKRLLATLKLQGSR